MKVYYSPDFDGLVVEGVRQVFPPRSLEYQISPQGLEIWLLGEGMRIAGPAPFASYTDQAGAAFASESDLTNYLDSQFALGGGITVSEVDDFDPGDLAALFQSS